MKKIKLNPGESIELVSSGKYGQNIIAEVMDDGVITYRIVHREGKGGNHREKSKN